jgi:YfiH family protein
VAYWIDSALREDRGLVVSFSERVGGVSEPPYDTLNLAAHVGDEPEAVDENRRRLLEALGLGASAGRLVTAEQVHGERIVRIDPADAGRGAHAGGVPEPVPDTDALLTLEADIPLLMCYADCVPVVLACTGGQRGIAVVHAGWRGVLARLPGSAVRALAEACGVEPSAVLAYIGPHIGACCYGVDSERMGRFEDRFGETTRRDGGLDLGSAVREDLRGVGVQGSAIAELPQCTSEQTEAFYSYRRAQTTGRHGALAAICSGQ